MPRSGGHCGSYHHPFEAGIRKITQRIAGDRERIKTARPGNLRSSGPQAPNVSTIRYSAFGAGATGVASGVLGTGAGFRCTRALAHGAGAACPKKRLSAYRDSCTQPGRATHGHDAGNDPARRTLPGSSIDIAIAGADSGYGRTRWVPTSVASFQIVFLDRQRFHAVAGSAFGTGLTPVAGADQVCGTPEQPASASAPSRPLDEIHELLGNRIGNIVVCSKQCVRSRGGSRSRGRRARLKRRSACHLSSLPMMSLPSNVPPSFPAIPNATDALALRSEKPRRRRRDAPTGSIFIN